MSESVAPIFISSELSEASILALKSLLGCSTFTIFAPNLDAAGCHLAAWAMSMLIEKERFVTFECEWSETPAFLLDSWLISVAESKVPLKIALSAEGTLLEPCTISMYGATPIRKITVHQFADRHEHEATQYDGTLVFSCKGGRRFAISCMLNGPGVAEYLHFSENEQVIGEMLADSKERLVIC